MRMKQTLLILLASVLMFPGLMRAQDSEESLYSNWGLGFQLGVGAMAPTGSLSDDLKGCALFTGGLSAEYKRLRFKADLLFSQPSFKNENPYNANDEQGKYLQRNGTASTTSMGAAFQVGYTVWHKDRVSITPCVGVNFNRLSWDMNTIKWEPDEQGVEKPLIDDVSDVHENSTGWTASVDIDIKLNGKFVDVADGSHYTSSLRISPFITYAGYKDFNPSIKGNWIGVTLGYSGLFRMLTQ